MCAVFLLEVFPFTLPVHADNPYVVSVPDRAIAGYQPARDTPLDMLDSTAHWSNILNGFSDGVPQGFMEQWATISRPPGEEFLVLIDRSNR